MGNFTDQNGVFVGSLYVEGTPLTTLSGMEPVTAIEGDFALRTNPQLTDMSSLMNLTDIGGNFALIDSPNLSSLDGVQNLRMMGQSLIVYVMDAVDSLEAFESLEKIGNNLIIEDNMSLKSVGLDSLMVTGSLQAACNESDSVYPTGVDIQSNMNLLDVGLNGIKTVCGSINLIWNYRLESIEFNNLTTIGDRGMLTVAENNNLRRVSGWPELTSVNDSLIITENPSMEEIDGLTALEVVGYKLLLYGNSAALTQITGLNSLETVEECCDVDPSALLDDLPACTTVCPP